MSPLIVSFSGGLSSGELVYLVQKHWSAKRKVYYVFANTGLERDETLEFVNMCDMIFGLNVIWLEAVVSPVHGVGISHKITNFENAYRMSEYKEREHPFHAFVRKHGVPNASFPQCSDRLKENVIESFKKQKGLKGLEHALGMRVDEPNRVLSKKKRDFLLALNVDPDMWRVLPKEERNALLPLTHTDSKTLKSLKNHNKYNLVYPLYDTWPTDKEDVNSRWEERPFTLGLEPHEGNCGTCWKKSDKKLYLEGLESPRLFDPMDWYEEQYGFINATKDGLPRVFFRNKRSAKDMLKLAGEFDSMYLRKMIGAQLEEGCGSSCEAYFDED